MNQPSDDQPGSGRRKKLPYDWDIERDRVRRRRTQLTLMALAFLVGMLIFSHFHPA